MQKRTLLLTLTLALISVSEMPTTARATRPRVVEQRVIEIPNTRLVSMSPNGRWFVAAKEEDRAYTQGLLCVYAVRTLIERSCGDLSVLEAGLRIEDVVWSPDGTRLAFSEEIFKRSRDGDLWIMDAESGELTNLDDDRYSGEYLARDQGPEATISLPVSPTFSPDGRTIAFSRSWIVKGARAGNEIAVVPVTGGPPERVTEVTPEELGIVYWGIRWAPDASRLYYSVHQQESDHTANGIWSVDTSGRNRRHLVRADPDLGAPAVAEVSPRGDKLLAFYPDAAMGVVAPTFYAIVDAATGVAEPITLEDTEVGPYPQVTLATFSPDGAQVLYTGRLAPSEFEVYVRSVNGGRDVRLAADLPGANGVWFGILPTWAPDGTVFVPAGQTLSSGTLLHVESSAGTSSSGASWR